MADEQALRNIEALFELLRAQAAAVAALPPSDREGVLAAVHARHERSGVEAGMSPEAALDMADRLDAWIREALSLTTRQVRPQTLH